jgi:hypothetical protein
VVLRGQKVILDGDLAGPRSLRSTFRASLDSRKGKGEGVARRVQDVE